MVVREIQLNPKTTAPKLAAKVHNEIGKRISPSTVRQILYRHGYHG